jgi:hypothetical protein
MLITLTLPLKGPENSTHGTEKFKQKKLVCPKTFESETLQFTETFEIECGKNNSGFLLYYIYTFKIIFVEF